MIKSALRYSAAVALAATGSALAQSAPAEWANFRGPHTDGIIAAPKVSNWRSVSLKPVWKTETTNGFGSFAVAGGKAYTIMTREADASTSMAG